VVSWRGCHVLDPACISSGLQLWRILRSSPNRIGLTKTLFMPLEKASCCAVADELPVKAIIRAGLWPRSRSKSRIAREESIPSMIGIEMSACKLGCFDARRQDHYPWVWYRRGVAHSEMLAVPIDHFLLYHTRSYSSLQKFREAIRLSLICWCDHGMW
jgi:hypothetical protein